MSDGAPDAQGEYCRAVEAYLCRKNDGHLVRIVGPSFELVCGWAARGVPLKVAYRGIDRCFERYYARGPRRRPVLVDFCDADVLDVFDEWRKALGVQAPAGDAPEAEAAPAHGRRESLPAHLERAIARLTALRSGSGTLLDGLLDPIVRELDVARAASKGLRGDARAAFLARLVALDASLLDAARALLSPTAIADARREAEEELAPFRGRMAPDVYDRALGTCTDRIIRERTKLPILALD